MATIAQQNEEDNKQNPDGGPTTVNGSGGAGASGTGQGGASATSPVQQNQASQANQGYTDVASYLNANQGYTDVASYLNANQGGSQQLGQSVAKNLNDKYTSTKQGVNDSYNQFAGQVNSGYVPENTDLINQVASNPTAAAGNADTLSKYQAQLNDSYTGPQSWADYGTQQGKVNDATQYASLANTPGGLNVYAQDVEGQNGGPQSAGINSLDTLLLGGSPEAMGQVQGAAGQYKDLNSYINAQNMAGAQSITDATSAASNASQHALDAFTGANGTLTNLNTSINNNASKALSDAQAQNASIQKDLGGVYSQPVDNTGTTLGTYGGGSTPWYNTTNYTVNNTLSPQDLAGLGLSQDQWTALQGQLQRAGTSEMMNGHNFGAGSPTSQIDLSQYLTNLDPSNINAATTATADQYAQMSAIQQLLGDKTPQGGAINPALASLAGTAPKSLSQFDYSGALSGATGTADAERKAAQDEANLLTGQADKAHADSQHGGGWLDQVKNVAKYVDPVSYLVNSGLASQGKKFNDKIKGS